MNEDQVTTLLDRLGRDIEVSNAPVVAATEDGRRRLRWRNRAQVGGAAAVVLALAGGGLVIQQQLTAEGQTATQPPVVPASAAELIGSWRPIMLAGNPTPPEGRTAKPISFGIERGTGGPTWSGNNGCNQVGGSVQLGEGGAFRASVRFMTQMACLGVHGSLGFSGVSAVKGARHVEIRSGRLQLTSASGTLLGVFVRYYPTQPPPHPAPLPGTVPTEAELFAAGKWFGPTGSVASGLGTETVQTVVAFTHRTTTSTTAHATLLSWSGYDGCNWVNGSARLTSEGHLSTSNVGSTRRACGVSQHAEPIHPVSSVDLLQAATQVRLHEGRLHFYDDGGRLLGILRPFTP